MILLGYIKLNKLLKLISPFKTKNFICIKSHSAEGMTLVVFLCRQSMVLTFSWHRLGFESTQYSPSTKGSCKVIFSKRSSLSMSSELLNTCGTKGLAGWKWLFFLISCGGLGFLKRVVYIMEIQDGSHTLSCCFFDHPGQSSAVIPVWFHVPTFMSLAKAFL